SEEAILKMEPTSGIAREMTFAQDGAQRYRAVLDSKSLALIKTALSSLPRDRAGIRLTGILDLNPHLLTSGPIGIVAANVSGPRARPVRAVLFDKTPHVNWKLGWHQDRTIVVQRRGNIEGYGPWSMKAG